jgi:hypothetical protein
MNESKLNVEVSIKPVEAREKQMPFEIVRSSSEVGRQPIGFLEAWSASSESELGIGKCGKEGRR